MSKLWESVKADLTSFWKTLLWICFAYEETACPNVKIFSAVPDVDSPAPSCPVCHITLWNRRRNSRPLNISSSCSNLGCCHGHWMAEFVKHHDDVLDVVSSKSSYLHNEAYFYTRPLWSYPEDSRKIKACGVCIIPSFLVHSPNPRLVWKRRYGLCGRDMLSSEILLTQWRQVPWHNTYSFWYDSIKISTFFFDLMVVCLVSVAMYHYLVGEASMTRTSTGWISYETDNKLWQPSQPS